jgi:hypothetical protein
MTFPQSNKTLEVAVRNPLRPVAKIVFETLKTWYGTKTFVNIKIDAFQNAC